MKEEIKILCFNYDKNYSKGHKFIEKKLFYIECEDEEYQEWKLHKV